MVKPLHFSYCSGTNTAGQITQFYNGLTRIYTLAQDTYAYYEIVYSLWHCEKNIRSWSCSNPYFPTCDSCDL